MYGFVTTQGEERSARVSISDACRWCQIKLSGVVMAVLEASAQLTCHTLAWSGGCREVEMREEMEGE